MGSPAGGVVAVLALLFVAATSSSAAAQLPSRTFEELRTELKIGDTIWVTARAGGEVSGQVIDLSEHTLAISFGGNRRHFGRQDVVRVTRQRSDPTWNGAAIGAGVVLAPLIWYCRQNFESGETCGEGIPWLVAYGAIGAGIGLAIDAKVRQRRVVYEQSVGATSVRVVPLVSARAAGIHVSVSFRR